MKQIIVSPDTSARLDSALSWLRQAARSDAVLLLAPSWEAADDAARRHALEAGAVFGLQRTTLDRLASRLAMPALIRAGRVPASGLALQAVVARTVFMLHEEGALRYFAPVADRPGFTPAVAQTLQELRMLRLGGDSLPAVTRAAADVAVITTRFERELEQAGLADRALIYERAIEAAAGISRHDLPTHLLLLDVALSSGLERDLVAMVSGRSSRVLATVPLGDQRSQTLLEQALGCSATVLRGEDASALQRLKRYLFSEAAPQDASLDSTLSIQSCPGEARECVEIARAIQAAAEGGTSFDRMAILLHAPSQYLPHVEEALERAEIPAFHAGGAARPHPAGRALLALLACAAERLSARRFAEYLSLGQVPDTGTTAVQPGSGGAADSTDSPPAAVVVTTPPNDAPATVEVTEPWVAPRYDLAALPGDGDDAPVEPAAAEPVPDPDAHAALGGTLRAPWRWEKLLVDAAVVGGRDRWARRLQGLRNELLMRRAAYDGKEEGRLAGVDRQLGDLAHLSTFVLPLIEVLDRLPGEATWGEWLPLLRELAARGLRDPAAVLATLAELEPMAPVGPIELDEVRLVLADRLQELHVPPPRRRYGAVFVAEAEAARGMTFDMVFVPGLVEKVFPQPVAEDPILLDAAREQLSNADHPDAALFEQLAQTDASLLDRQQQRAARERLALRLAVGAARRHLWLSYPRIGVEQGRPRVPSFYALETLRAAEGVLPGFQSLAERVRESGSSRLGWPAPVDKREAIDEAEYDLALLAPLLSQPPDETVGTATYLLNANAHLARALRFRAGRWRDRWSRPDGLVLQAASRGSVDDLAREALDAHGFQARSYSPTALQKYASCPYRFFLGAVQKLEPRDELDAPELLDPLTRGSLFHEVQFELLTALQAEGRLPLREPDVEAAVEQLDRILSRVDAETRDRLAPAIPRVWDDGIAAVRADLREWLRRSAAEQSQWIPWRFELSFGLVAGDRGQADEHSRPEPVTVLDGLQLRGSIDLVERSPDGVVRATDHKTGKVYGKESLVVQRGEILQPLLYALACEQLGMTPVESGRLYYCTADGGYRERVVELDARNRETVRQVVATIGSALQDGFLPAAPLDDACRWCDYRTVCGPKERERVRRKPTDALQPLDRVRSMP